MTTTKREKVSERLSAALDLFNPAAISRVLGVERSNFAKQIRKPTEETVRKICPLIRVNPEWVLHGEPHEMYAVPPQNGNAASVAATLIVTDEQMQALLNSRAATGGADARKAFSGLAQRAPRESPPTPPSSPPGPGTA